MARATAVLALWNDVVPGVEADYEEWHADEHVPERLTVPGMSWGRRYERCGGGPAPRYLTLYGMRDAQVVQSDAYRLLLSRPTPASARMRPHLCNVSRWVCEVREIAGLLASPGLAAWTFDAEDTARRRAGMGSTGTGELLLAERSLDAAPLPWLTGAQVRSPIDSQEIGGSWLLAMGLREGPCDAGTTLPEWTRGATIYRALPVRHASA